LLSAAALGVVARCTAALSAPSAASACRWRPLDLAGARGGEAAPQITSELGWCVSLHVVELAECGARAAPVGLVLSHLAEEDETRPLQGLSDPGGVDDAAEGCTQVHHGDVRGILLWEQSILLLWKKAFGRWALGAQGVAAPLFSQGHHLNHGAQTAAFTTARASIAERVEDVGHLLREGLGDVEAVAADVEEGAAVAEAILEVGQVVADAVEGAKPPDKAGGDLLAKSR
jgi:hypothetical protein